MRTVQRNSEHVFTATTNDGIKLHCALTKKPGRVDSSVLLIHGRLHNRCKGPLCAIEPLLSSPTISFDARGMGWSEGETSYNNVDQEVEDLRCVFAAIQTLDWPFNQIKAIIGHSKGAVVLLTAASKFEMPCRLLISLSVRYDSENLQSNTRFSPAQYKSLEDTGSFVWMRYRVKDGSERRPYLVTKQDVNAHATRKLDCVQRFPKDMVVLCLHGKADGTIPFDHTLKLNADINKSQAAADVMLLEGVAHNWDGQGEPYLLAGLVNGWIQARENMEVAQSTELVDHLGQHRVTQ